MTTDFKNRITNYGVKPASSFAPNPANFRAHPAAQLAALNGALSELGWIGVVIENTQTGRLIDGHARLTEAIKRGSETPVPYVSVDLTEEEERLALATFDPIGSLAKQEKEALRDLLSAIDTGDDQLKRFLADLGQSVGMLKAPGAGGDDFDTTVRTGPTRSQFGDLWQLGDHRLLVGDSTKPEDIEKLMQGEHAAAVVTDLPYNIDKHYSDDHTDTVFYGVRLPAWFAVAAEVLNRPSHFVTTFSERDLVRLVSIAESAGYQHRHTGVLHNPNRLAGSYPGQWPFAWEPVLDFTIGGWRALRNGNGVGRSDVWIIDSANQGVSTASSDYHPAKKPLELYESLLSLVTDRGEIVFDPCAGAGTTLIASHRQLRICLAVELSTHYADVALRRWEAETGREAQLMNRSNTCNETREVESLAVH